MYRNIWEPLTQSQRYVENTSRMIQHISFEDMDENYTDLVEANGLRDRRHKHDDGNRKALQVTWSFVWLKSRTLVPWNITQKHAKKLGL